MRPLVFVLLTLGLTGCAATPAVTIPTAAELAGSAWSEVCPDSNPERSFMRLHPDGQFAWSYDSIDDASADSGETWSVSGTSLVISWNEGFATTTYDLGAMEDGVAPGVSSKDCGDRAQRVRL